jgi:hypothetical protein
MNLRPLIQQPTLLPTRKVGAGGLAGAVSILIIAAAHQVGLEIPAELASAVTTVATFAIGWLVRERAAY